MRPFVVRKFNCGQTMRSLDKTLCSLIMLISRASKGLRLRFQSVCVQQLQRQLYQLAAMESNQHHSVVDLVKCPVRPAHFKRSQVCGQVSNKPFTDFSIRRILGLENEDTDNSSLPGELHLL